ncbi:xylan 1,4-beta-xylosidase [Microtetraspora sp. AC03309]|uniref:GH39 family glycosyl hydrolase n=1 Tax=Microtetraspora sp. AC03309 TaxID=2779376 RepID=UPI001E38BD1A|nr:xylan 1,4-beta-xylosidase [Microtetraspora sp. AC03309]
MRVRFRRWAGTAAGATLMGLILIACTLGNGTSSRAVSTTEVTATEAAATASTWPVFGFTHTQYTVDYGRQPALRTVRNAIAEKRVLQNQHIMGFGALNPEPSPGKYDFASLDDRIELIRKTRGIPVITLCCAPDWMKGGSPGETDWNRIEAAPLPGHYQDFADLAAKVARRYPDVTHFIVWNELKGFFDEDKHRWNYEGYTDMYNRVYKALKDVNPKIEVGGPYPALGGFDAPSELHGDWGNVDQRVLDALRYWIRHNKGADFIVVDGTSESDKGLVPDEFGALKKFSAVNGWLRRHTDLPIWWAEWYAEPADSGWPENKRLAVHAAAMMEFARSRTAAALYWSRQEEGEECPEGCLWTSPRAGGGGKPTALLRLLQEFARSFPQGTKTVPVDVAPSSVLALAQQARIVVVNTQDKAVKATVDGKEVDLSPYEVRWISRG